MRASIAGVVLVVAAMAAPAPDAVMAPAGARAAAQQQNRTTRLIAGPATFQRADETYRLTVSATDELDGQDDLVMTVRRVRDPDGAGPARSRQVHMRQFQAAQLVATDPDLASATVDTGDRLTPYGAVNLEFTPTAPAERAPCAGAQRTVREGRVDGRVWFASGTRFGDVVLTSLRARLDSVEGACLPSSLPPPACPRPGWSLWAQDRDLRVSAFKGRRGLVVVARRESNLPTRDPATEGYLIESSVTRLPLDHARFAADLGSATVRGLRGTDVRRRATFSATSRVRRDVSDCYDETRETVERRRRGTVEGTMRFAFFIGPDERLINRPLQGNLTRFRNRPSG